MTPTINFYINIGTLNVTLFYFSIIAGVMLITFMTRNYIVGILIFIPFIDFLIFKNTNNFSEIREIILLLAPCYIALAVFTLRRYMPQFNRKIFFEFFIVLGYSILFLILFYFTENLLITITTYVLVTFFAGLFYIRKLIE